MNSQYSKILNSHFKKQHSCFQLTKFFSHHFKLSFIFIPLSILVLSACGNPFKKGKKDQGGKDLVIKGDFGSGGDGGYYFSWIDHFFSLFVGTAHAVNEAEVKQVVVFSPGKSTGHIQNVSSGQLNARASKKESVVLAFADAADNYLGYLTMGGGIDSVPTTLVNSQTKEIDLKSLSLSKKVITPSQNINDLEVFEGGKLNGQTKSMIAQMDDFLAIMAINSDLDRNGKIDVLEGMRLKIDIGYSIHAGEFDNQGDFILYTNKSKLLNGWKLSLRTEDSNPPPDIYFTGPSGSGLNNTKHEQSWGSKYGDKAYGTPNMEDTFPVKGEYTIQYGSKKLKFILPDQSKFADNIVLAQPQLIYDSSDKLVEIKWVWKTPKGEGGASLASKVIADAMIQIDDDFSKNTSDNPKASRIYDSKKFSNSENSVKISKTIYRSQIKSFNMAYNDVFGTHYVVSYKPKK